MQLSAMLGFIIMNQTLLLWILDQNFTEPKYEGFHGLFNCLSDSYWFALGDF